MTKFLISFPASAMDVPAEELAAVGEAARAVVRGAKAAGIYVFAGGINADIGSLLVASDGSSENDTYRQTRSSMGAFVCLNSRQETSPSNGRPSSPKPAAARKSCASSTMILKAEEEALRKLPHVRTCKAGAHCATSPEVIGLGYSADLLGHTLLG